MSTTVESPQEGEADLQNEMSLQRNTHRRVGKVSPVEETFERLSELEEHFILSDTPDTVGGNLNDDDTVQACLNSAIDYFHQNIPDDIREFIFDKWGISNDTIDDYKIGYVDGTNDVIDHLRSEGFSELTISRAGLGTISALKHIFECSGVSIPQNCEFESLRDEEISSGCNHEYDWVINTLLRAQLQGLIQPEQINLEAVLKYLKETDQLYITSWWDNRITFPYKNSEGEFCYLIVRETPETETTDETDDIIYSNGVTDRSNKKYTPLSDTFAGDCLLNNRKIIDKPSAELDQTIETILEYDTAELDNYHVLPPVESTFNDPRDIANAEHIIAAFSAIEDHLTNFEDPTKRVEIERDLMDLGLLYQPDGKGPTESDTADVHILKSGDHSSDTRFVVTPAAIGISPEERIKIRNHTNHQATLSVNYTPPNSWWDSTTLLEESTFDCPEQGIYKYTIDIDGEMHRGAVAAFDTVHTKRRIKTIEDHVREMPTFELDKPKYIKQTIDRAWINNDVISEPIFGVDTVNEGRPLVVTEGITDAIVAHQYNIPSVTPATTNFKRHHYDELTYLSTKASDVYIVNDNETHKAGLHGALRTGMVLKENDINVKVGELPLPDNAEKIDVAEFFKTHSQEDFLSVIETAVDPEEHPLNDPEIHQPKTASASKNGDVDQNPTSSENNSPFSFDHENVSHLYKLSLGDVINWNELSLDNRSGSTIYRGVNPLHHQGGSENYFRINDFGEFITAKDFKMGGYGGDGYYYNHLGWLASAATCDCPPSENCDCTRSPREPRRSLSNSEVWWAWKYAHEAAHIDFPDDDRVPKKAMWFIAEYHDLMPSEYIPESFDDEHRLPESIYNEVLDIIENEYGLSQGRCRLNVPNDE